MSTNIHKKHRNISRRRELSRFVHGMSYFNEIKKDLYVSPSIYQRRHIPEYTYIDREHALKHTGKPNSIVEVKIEKLENIGDLIDIIDKHPLQTEKDVDIEYNINMKQLHHIKDELVMLNSFIGMTELKTNILNQLLYFIQGFHQEDEYMHMILFGPPGTGKTEIAMCLGKLFCKLGILKKEQFKKVVRSDLIAGYLGQTALKTAKVIEESIGGVLFIDEVYALGHREKDDLFSKECIDTLCESLSANRNQLMVIIAGYEEDIKQCFLKVNKGLESRFPWTYTIKEYTSDELHDIFMKKVDDSKWRCTLDKKETKEWFKKHHEEFKYFGRDMETFLTKLKVVHSKRMFGKSAFERKNIVMQDLDDGIELFREHKVDKEKKNAYIDTFGMYT